MSEVERELREDPRLLALVGALRAAANDPDLTLRFLRDLLSHGKLSACANRWAVARALAGGETQAQVARRLRVSGNTVGEVAWSAVTR